MVVQQSVAADGHGSSHELPIQLRFDCHDRIEVIAADQDRFYTTVSHAAHACRVVENQVLWARQFEEFLREIHNWCETQGATVASCFVTWGDGVINVIVVTRGGDYRFSFDDDITSLNVRLANIHPECPAEVIQIPNGPPEMLRSFFAAEKALQVYGDNTATPRESRA
jgi:hypothetical protein